MISLSQLHKTYTKESQTVRALDDVTLSVPPGEFVVVHGPSGCGKTTLLLTIGGLLAPSMGNVTIDGTEIYDLSADRRAAWRAETVGFMFQQFHLIPYLSVRENILTALLPGPVENAANRAVQLMEEFGLADRAHHLPGEISTGQRQRTALARALMRDPAILLADEPTGNLDPDNAAILMEHFSRLTETGKTILLVTHQTDLDTPARRTIYLRDGKIQQQSTQ